MTRQDKFNGMMQLQINRDIIKQVMNLTEWDFQALQSKYIDSRIKETHLLKAPKLKECEQVETRLWDAMEGHLKLGPEEFEALKMKYSQFNVYE